MGLNLQQVWRWHQSWVVQLIHWRKSMPSRRTLADLGKGPLQNSWSSTKPSTRSCMWAGAIPSISADWELMDWEHPCREGLGVPADEIFNMRCWAASKVVWLQSVWGDSVPLLWSHKILSVVLYPALGSPGSERCRYVRTGPEKGHASFQRETSLL